MTQRQGNVKRGSILILKEPIFVSIVVIHIALPHLVISMPTFPILSKSSSKPSLDPIQNLLGSIQALEDELNVLESVAPNCIQSMRETLHPFAVRMQVCYTQFLEWLGSEFRANSRKKGYQGDIQALALFLFEQGHAMFGFDLTHILLQEGFTIPPPPEAAPSLQWDSFETEFVKPKSPPKAPHHLHKKLYYDLAKNLHPDKGDLTDREHRTQLMQQLNQAYQQKDLKTLLTLLNAHGSSNSVPCKDSLTQKSILRALKVQHQQTQLQLKTRLGQYPTVPYDWRVIAQKPLLWKQILRQEKRQAEQDCVRMETLFDYLKGHKELNRFFSRFQDSQWKQIF